MGKRMQGKFPPTILIKWEEDMEAFVVGTPEDLAEPESVSAARYRLVNTGVIHSHFDYVEDDARQVDDE